MTTLQDEIVGDIRTPLLVLLGAMAFVLLIACSNVANLFLVRAEARTRESAVRLAMGSGRARLVRYVLTESLLLALVGGVAGALLAWVGTRALVAAAPASIPRLDEIGISGRALLYTVGISIFAGLLFGVFPALRTRADAMPYHTQIESTHLAKASRIVSAASNFPVQYNKAIVVKNAFAHESGIHQDGMLKNAQTYEIMTPASVGIKETTLVMGKHSGRAAFKDKLRELGYELGDNAFQEAFVRFKDLADRK